MKAEVVVVAVLRAPSKVHFPDVAQRSQKDSIFETKFVNISPKFAPKFALDNITCFLERCKSLPPKFHHPSYVDVCQISNQIPPQNFKMHFCRHGNPNICEKESIHLPAPVRNFSLPKKNGSHRGQILVDTVFLGFCRVFASTTGLERFSLRPEKFSKRFSFGGGRVHFCVHFFLSVIFSRHPKKLPENLATKAQTAPLAQRPAKTARWSALHAHQACRLHPSAP